MKNMLTVLKFKLKVYKDAVNAIAMKNNLPHSELIATVLNYNLLKTPLKTLNIKDIKISVS